MCSKIQLLGPKLIYTQTWQEDVKVKFTSMPWRHMGEQVWLYLHLTLALNGGEQSTSHPNHFTRGKRTHYLLNRRLGEPQSQTEHFWRMFSCMWLLLAMLGSEETELIIFVKLYRMYVHCCLAVKCAINTQQHYLLYCPYMNDADSEPVGIFGQWNIRK